MVPYRYGYVGREHQTESDVKLPFFQARIKTSIYERVPAVKPGLFDFGCSEVLAAGPERSRVCGAEYAGLRVRYLRPSRLAVSLGRAFLLTMIDVVLYSTNGREKYQKPS